ncbi:hypothetical protein LDENG_00274320 [Lucifuga dentata]|nr:hypothetical protein LDENG_00274320 [Lucifuga dentata]
MMHGGELDSNSRLTERDGMWACRSLQLVLLLLTARTRAWRPCTDLQPLDLLARALPRPGQAPPTQVQMVQSRGSRGIRLAGAMATALSFPASQIFTNCDYFPAEFSLVTTFKIPRLKQKVMQHHTTQHNAHNTTQHNTTQHNAHNTIQHNAMQYNTI